MKKIGSLLCTIMSITIITSAQNTGIGTASPVNKLDVVGTASSLYNSVIYATNTGTTGNAILSESNNAGTYGVKGLSSTGTGVQGYTTGGVALVGISLSGMAIYAFSSNGYGLQASGKLRFYGGDMNPSNGAVLTSDASGNATWKPVCSFFAKGAVNPAVAGTNPTKVEFMNEEYDLRNNFANYAGTATNTSSVFTAPVAGSYHFSAAVLYKKVSPSQFPEFAGIQLDKRDTPTSLWTTITENKSNMIYEAGILYYFLNIETDVYLEVNEQVCVRTSYETNGGGAQIGLDNNNAHGRFSGELIF
ncbi:MAG: hypothetical protein V4722_00180 [Bacteroidota bacterium]